MTEKQFRELALSLPESTEAAHMAHPDFRVGGRIFASLTFHNGGANKAERELFGMVRLTPEEQRRFVRDEPGSFRPVSGGWGLRGATYVPLKAAKLAAVRSAILAAWRNTAPKQLVERFDAGPA